MAFDFRKLPIGALVAATDGSSLSLAQQLVAAAGGTANVAGLWLYGVNATVASGTLSAWADARGSGPTLAQATGSKQPANGGTNYTFDGVDDFMQVTYTLNQPLTRFLVFNPITWVNGAYVYDGGTADSTVLQQIGGTDVYSPYAGTSALAKTIPTGTYAVHTAIFNGASSLAQVNDASSSSGNLGANNAGGLTLGARGTGATAFANIGVKAAMDLNVAASAGQRTAIKAVLYSAYGIVP